MASANNQSTETPSTDFTKTWRYKVGLTMIIVGNLGILFALVMPALGAGTGTVGAWSWAARLVSLASIIFLGKAGFKAIKSKFVGAVKASYTGSVGKTRNKCQCRIWGHPILAVILVAIWAATGNELGSKILWVQLLKEPRFKKQISKHEYRDGFKASAGNPKQIQKTNFQIFKTHTPIPSGTILRLFGHQNCFGHCIFCHSDLFRDSIFEFRVLTPTKSFLKSAKENK